MVSGFRSVYLSIQPFGSLHNKKTARRPMVWLNGSRGDHKLYSHYRAISGETRIVRERRRRPGGGDVSSLFSFG